ncbi:hypothetical protein HPO96_21550 [Kribbella sandramycini]|uniref:Uncharacterized protein n=1 Tax=Kribbella sandramycini TaxID=60450 RepID=A0A7Y4L1X2_9ACTN|nr:hypothetical protein [Kribbella sandramycini]MBB6566508.1 hypothetical protein [Kribbella sandramycini]NOL42835.1 hypothetical protein [Kribbella sandramycini]
MDVSEQQVTESLARHAADAPSDHGLLTRFHSRRRRRSTGRAVGAAVLAAAAVATTFTAANTLRTEPQLAQVGPAKAGWRWESYKTATIQVPADWTNYIAGPAPCTFMRDNKPVVGRLYDWQDRQRYTCTTAFLPPSRRQPYVWFDDVQAPGVKRYDDGWSEETLLVGGTKISVLAPTDELRLQIVESARPITGADAYGCTPKDTLRTDLPSNDPADGANVCEYYKGQLVAASHIPPRRAAQLSRSLAAESYLQPASPAPGCSGQGASTYVVTLFPGRPAGPVASTTTHAS